jgi:hypothetical protein
MRRALMVAVALMLVVPAFAEGTTARTHRGADRVPSAQLQAAGSGVMTVAGRMVVNGTIPERGSVVVIDRAGDAKVHLAGEPQEFFHGRVRVRRASGILFVTGSDVTVQVLGIDLTFSVAGNGRARLLGSGSYQLNSGPEKRWSRAWIRVAPSSSAERRRLRRCADCSSSAALRH